MRAAHSTRSCDPSCAAGPTASTVCRGAVRPAPWRLTNRLRAARTKRSPIFFCDDPSVRLRWPNATRFSREGAARRHSFCRHSRRTRRAFVGCKRWLGGILPGTSFEIGTHDPSLHLPCSEKAGKGRYSVPFRTFELEIGLSLWQLRPPVGRLLIGMEQK